MATSTRFEGRVVVVTGGATGLGRAIPTRFLEEGAKLVALDIVAAPVDATEGVNRRYGERFETRLCDVGDSTAVEAAFDLVLEQDAKVDVLVNNAGVSSVAVVVDLAESQWDRIMRVNAKGTFLRCRAVLPSMLKRGAGSIVNVASQAGRRRFVQIEHYCAAKAAVLNFSRALALEVAPTVRVNCVCPGTIATPMVLDTLERQALLTPDHTAADLMEATIDAIPLKRLQ